MFLNKIPFLADVDFSDSIVRKKAMLVGLAVASAIGLIIYIAVSGDEEVQSSQMESEVVSTKPLQIQNGEDLDNLSSRSNRDIYRSGDGSSLSEKLFGKGGIDSVGNALPTTSDIISEGVVGHGAVGGVGLGEQDVFGQARSRVAEAKNETEQGEGNELSREEKYQKRKQQREAEYRQKLIDMGLDPDTGTAIQPQNTEKSTRGTKKAATKPVQETIPVEPVLENPPESQTKEEPEVILMGDEIDDDDNSFGVGTRAITASKKKTDKIAIKVMFAEEGKVKSGDRIRLRLLEKDGFILNGIHIPKNTLLFANVTVGERVFIKIGALNINGQILPLNYEAYDNDGERGIYCPSSNAEEAIKETGQEALQIGQSLLQSRMGVYGARAVNLAASQGKKGAQSVYLSSGYTFYLMKEE